MEWIYKSHKICKINNITITNYDANRINSRALYYKNHNKIILIINNKRGSNYEKKKILIVFRQNKKLIQLIFIFLLKWIFIIII